MICIVFAVDFLLFAEDYGLFGIELEQLRDAELDLNVEEDATEFLGISTDAQLPHGVTKLIQQLIEQILAALDLRNSHS